MGIRVRKKIFHGEKNEKMGSSKGQPRAILEGLEPNPRPNRAPDQVPRDENFEKLSFKIN